MYFDVEALKEPRQGKVLYLPWLFGNFENIAQIFLFDPIIHSIRANLLYLLGPRALLHYV
jgi:hypothetical protein